MNLSRRHIGLNFEDGKAWALVWAPKAKKVALQFHGQSLPMQPEPYGYWSLPNAPLKPGDQYQFQLDDQTLPDIASLSQPDVHGASVAVDLSSYNWNDQNWKNPELKDYLIYELHTGTFTAEGTFEAILAKLDYLCELGISAIELMPVAQFPGDRNWGYDGVFPFAVQDSYGGAIGLQRLVDHCHQNGLAVILDVVYNHLGPEGNYLAAYGSYFTDKYQTPWGQAINFDDADCDPVRELFIENALMWFRDFHIDALRMDAVHAIKDFSVKPILQELQEKVQQFSQHSGKPHYLIVECDLNDPRFINPPDKGGYGLHAQWNDEFHHALRVAAGGKQEGYYSDFDGVSSLAESYRHAYVYYGQYSAHRRKRFGADPVDNAGQQFVVFSQNHDQVGNRMLGERSSQLFSFEMQKLMAGAVLVSPFLPMLFMGEEFAANTPFQYFVSHGDAELIEAVRKGRSAEFAAFHAAGAAPDPQDPATFMRSKLNWQEQNQTMLNYYKALIRIRKETPELHANGRAQLQVSCDAGAKQLTLCRGRITCYLDFQKEYIRILQAGKTIFDSAAQEWGGPHV